MSNQNEVNNSKESKAIAKATVTGVTSATALAWFANTLPADNKFKPLLIIIAPSLTAIISKLYKYFEKRIQKKISDKERDYAYEKARKTILKFINDPHASEDHKKKMKKSLEQLESKFAEDLISEIKIMN